MAKLTSQQRKLVARGRRLPSAQRTPAQKAALAKAKSLGLIGSLTPGTGMSGLNVNALTPLTSAQQATLAGQLTNMELAPQLSAVNAQIARDQAQAQQQASTLQGFTSAALPVLSQIAPQVQAGYQNAAGMDVNFAKGFSDMLNHVASGDALKQQQILQTQGLPQQSIDAVQNIGPAAGDVLYGTGGYIPGTTLGAEGAAQTALAAGLPSIAQSQGNEAMRTLLANARTQQQSLSQQLADIEATRGDKTAANLQNLMQNELQKFQTLAAAKAAGINVGLAQQKFNLQNWYDQQRIAQGQQNADTASQRAATYAQNQKNKGKGKQKTMADVNAAKQDFAAKIVSDNPSGFTKKVTTTAPAKNPDGTLNPNAGKTVTKTVALSLPEAKALVRRQYADVIVQLRRLGVRPKVINQLVDAALGQLGYAFTPGAVANSVTAAIAAALAQAGKNLGG